MTGGLKIVSSLVGGIVLGITLAALGECFFNPQHLLIIPIIGFIAGLMVVNAILAIGGFF